MAITITKQPENQVHAPGSTVRISVEASGDSLTYQWEYRKPTSSTWVESSAAGATSAQITFIANVAQNGYVYHCIITDANGDTVTTDEITLTVYTPVSIVKQPTSKAGFEGDTIVFAVEAAGDGLTYQWYWRANNSAAWELNYLDTAQTSALALEILSWRNGYQYRCQITDALGNVAYTVSVTLVALDVTTANGLVPSETMTAIGDAIREKTGDVARMLPTDMPAMIRSIGGRPIYTGYFDGDGGIGATYSLGVSLPEYDNYSFIVMPADGTGHYCGVKMVIGSFSLDYLHTTASISLDGWNIDFANGTIQHQFFNPENMAYKWWYFEEYIG